MYCSRKVSSGLQKSSKEPGGLGSYTDQKVVDLSKIEGDYSYQFYSRPFDKVEEDGNLYVTIAV